MPFSVQYQIETGAITATVNSRPADTVLLKGIAQLCFDDWQCTEGKKVDLETLTLVDDPPILEV